VIPASWKPFPLTLFVLLMAFSYLPAWADDDWPFPDEFRSRLVFVHPLVNYAVNPVWQRQWERSLVSRNGVQTTVGSVATDDLFTDLTVNITEPLGGRFRFLYRMVWRDGLHQDLTRQEHWPGFEMGLSGGMSVHLQVHPAADKEEFDLLTGLMITDTSREQFLRVSLRLDDFIFEKKNDLGAVSQEEPVGLQWEGRYQSGRWELFSAGRYGSGSRRSYPDSSLSPVVAETYRRDGAATLRLRRLLEDPDFLGLEVSHYRFEASEQGRDEAQSFDYSNEYVHLRGLGVIGIGGPWGLRPEIHWLRQWATADGRREFTHRRDDFFPALFAELNAPGKSTWELGYMGTHHQWEYSVGGWSDDRQGYTDKIKLGWTYAFLPTARLQFSLSHELDLDRFGGGNVQFQTVF
jgi:hypothetical protein